MPRRRKRPRNGPRNEYVGLSGTLPGVSLNNTLSLEVESGHIEHHRLDEDGWSIHFQLDYTSKAAYRRNVGESGDVLFGRLSSEAAIMECPLGPELPQGTSKVLQLLKDNRQQERQPLTPHQPDRGLSEGTCSSDDHFLGAGDDFIPLNTPQQSGSVRGVECGEHTGERSPVTKWFRSPAKRPRAQQKSDQPTTSKSPPAKSGLKTAKGNKQHCIDTFDARDVIVRLHTSEASGSSRGVECGEHTGGREPNTKWFRTFVKRLQALQKPDQATTSKSPSTRSGLKATKGNIPSSGTTVGGLTSKTNPQKIILPKNTTTKTVAKKTKGKSKKKKTPQEATTPPKFPPKRVVRTVDYTKDIDVSNPFAVSFRSPVKRDNAMDSVFQGKKRRISRSFGGIYSEREPPNMFLVNEDPNWQVVKEDLPYYRSRLKRPVICDVCYSDKHSRRKCRKFRMPCVICGAYDHLERFCTKKAMYFGEYWTLKQFRYRNYTCQTCGTGGHLARSCTNHWRQFHNTTASSVSLQRLDRNDQRNDEKVFCFNCGLEGHLGFECRSLLNRLRTPIMAHQPFVYKYTAKFNPKFAYMKPLPGFEKYQPSSPDTSYYEEMEEYSHEVDHREVDRREVDGREVDHHQVVPREVDHREVDGREVDHREVNRREVDHREVDHREVDHREVDHGEVDCCEVDHREVDCREVDRREVDSCEVDRCEVDRREVDRREVDSREVDRREVDRRQVNRCEVDHREVDHHQVVPREVDRREVDRREVDRREVDCRVVDHGEVDHREVNHCVIRPLSNEFPTREDSQNTLSNVNVERDLMMTEGGSSRDLPSSLRRDEEHVLELLNGLIDENGPSRKRGRDDGSSNLGDDNSRLQTREGCDERLSSNNSHVVRLPALEHQSNGLSEQEGRTDLVDSVVGMSSKASEGKGAKRKRKQKRQRLNSKASVESTSCIKGGGNSDEVTSLPPVKKKKKIRFSRNIPQGAFVVLPERLIEFRPYLFPLDANYTFLETKRLNRFFKKCILHCLEKKDRHSRKEPYGSWGPHVIVVSKYRENLAFAISSLKGKPEVEDLSSLHQRFEDLFKLSLLWVLEFEIEGRRKAEVNALRTLFSDEEGWDEGYITALTVLPALDFKHYSQVATRKAHISHKADTLDEDVTPSTSNTEAAPVTSNQNGASGTTELPIPSHNNQNQSSSLDMAVFQTRPSVQSEQVVLSPTSTQEEGIPSQSEPTSLTEDPSQSPTRATLPSKRSKRLSYLSPELEKYLSENFNVLDSWEFGSDDVREEEVSLHESRESRSGSTTLDSTSGALCNTASEISTSSTSAVGVLHNGALTVSSSESTSKAPSLHNTEATLHNSEATLHNSTTMSTPNVTLGGSQSPKVGFGSEFKPDSSFNSKSPDFKMGSNTKSNTRSNSLSHTHHSELSQEEEHHHIIVVNEDSVSSTSPTSQNSTECGRLGKKRQLDLFPGEDLSGSTEKIVEIEETNSNERVMQSSHRIEASRSAQTDRSIEIGEGSRSTSETGVHVGSEVPSSPNSLQLAIDKTLLGMLPVPIMSELSAQQTSNLTGATGSMGEIPDSSEVMPLMPKRHTEVGLCEVDGPTEPAVSTSDASTGVKNSQTATTNPVATTDTTDPVATTGTTDPVATTGTTDPVATTGTTDPVTTTGTTDPVATTGTTDPVATTGTTCPPSTLKPIFLEEADVPLVQSIDCYCLTKETIQMLQVRRSELKISPKSKSRWKTKVSPTSKLPATISLTDVEKERMCEYLEELRKELDILKQGRSEMKWNQELKKQKSWRGSKPAPYSSVVDVTDRSVPCMDRWRTIQDLLTLFMCQYVRKVERLSLPEVTNRMRKAWRDGGTDWN